MQQNTVSAEILALLPRIAQTSQSLNRALDKYVHNDPFAPQAKSETLIVAANDLPVKSEETTVLPVDGTRQAPVLTIKLADLVQAGNEARRRRLQAAHRLRRQSVVTPTPAQEKPPVVRRPARPARPARPVDRVYREIEVIRRKGLRLVS